uniref:Transporter associated with antigen processing, subunit type a n=1 Tax=Electrophorus electricus TaxID=8005 RepID=A0AAY5ENH6_ELEEL
MRRYLVFAFTICTDFFMLYMLDFVDTCLRCRQRSLDGTDKLVRQWVKSVLRWALLYTASIFYTDLRGSVAKRWILTHCFIGPMYETGRLALFGNYPLAKFDMWLVGSVAAALGCLFWEMLFPDSNGESNGKERKQKARVLFMRVIHLYQPDYLLLIGASVFLALAVLCEMFIPLYTGKLIDILRVDYHWEEFRAAIIFMTLYSFGSSFSAGCRGGLFMCAIGSFICRVKLQLFSSLVKQEIGFFETTKTGDITSRLSTDTTLMARAVALNVNILLRTLIKILGMLYLMFSLSWKLTLLVLMETPLTGLLQNIYDTHYQRLSKEVQDSIARANDAASEAVSGIRTLKSFNTEQSESHRYNDRLMNTHKLKTQRDTVRAVYLLLRRLIELGVNVAMLHYGRLFIQYGQMSTGNLVSFILYQSNLGNNIRSLKKLFCTLIYIFGDILNSVGAAGKVFEYLDRTPEVNSDGILQPEELKGHVCLQNLTFSYPTRSDLSVLKDFSLELKPGQMTALVGKSGGGKSTCVSLLQRFYQPQQGQILLDRQPLENYQHKYLHSKIVAVGQEPVLFCGTVRENIAYGLPHCSDERVEEAARKANAHDFICQLQKGYDTDVGEQGSLLASGQKQRIAIARALIRQPQVLLLDEITSFLDTESEQMVQQALANCPNQTLLVIAHRLKTIERADQIVLIDQGRVLEQGTHQELMKKRGHYFKLKNRLFTEESTHSEIS